MHEGLGAVVARAHGYAQLVEQGAKVEVVYAFDVEGNDAAALWCVAVDVQAVYVAEAFKGMAGEAGFGFGNAAPRPTLPAKLGVPASNLKGRRS